MSRTARIDSWTDADSYVQFKAYIDGTLVLQTYDTSRLRVLTPGTVGIRGDNCEFEIDGFQVWSL